MAINNSANMNLPVPGVGNEAGPDYAFDVNSCLTLVDQHDHSPGRGVQITPAGLNINASLTMNDNSLTDVNEIVFEAQDSPDSTLQSLYVAPGIESPLTEDLWFTDGNGVQVQITSGGTVNATIASIPGESFSAGTFFWKQGTGSTTPANFDIGSITIRPNLPATTYGVRLTPNAGISSQYDLILPLLPLSNSVMTLDQFGNITTPTVFPLPAAGLAANSVTTSKIVDQNVTTAKIALLNITPALLSNDALSTNSQTFNTSGSFIVPVGVNYLTFLMFGGGGGGGGGGSNGLSAGGGGGGGGSVPQRYTVSVSPGDTVAIVIGAGGAAGGGGPSGTNGTVGSNTTISVNAVLVLTASGGNGGIKGTNGSPGGAGGAFNFSSSINAGGNGGNAGVAGQNGDSTPYGAGGLGAGAGQGGGGGGGGAGYASGANGSGGGTNSAGGNGGAGGANIGAGGGGGGGGGNGGFSGGNGGPGGSGKVIIYWQGKT